MFSAQMTEILTGTLGLALLVLPGWRLAHAHRLRLPALLGLLGGGLALLTMVLLLQLLGSALNAITIGASWLAWSLVALLLARRAAAKFSQIPQNSRAPFRLADAWPWLIALPVIAAVVYRAMAHPLFGTDTHFRWGFLAEQMWTRGHLSFYPPVSAAGFEIYAWPDGIPPLVSSIYFALYCLAGGITPAVTGPVVAVQFVLLLVATGALARRMFSAAAGNLAVALLGVTPLAAWAVAMGQETGFTALALVGLFLYLPIDRDEETRAAMIAAGVAAAVGAVAREYGWAFVALGLGLAWRRGLSARGLAWFAGVVAATAVPWYARNYVLSGNPFFNLSAGGLFPVNEAHAALMANYREHFAFMRQLGDWGLRPFLTCAVVALAAAAGAARFFRPARPLVLVILVVGALWVASVPYTAAGIMYSLRVLNPALALGAVLGGAALAGWTPAPRWRTVALALLALLGLDAALRTLVLPDRPYRRTPAEWFTADLVPSEHERQKQPLFDEIARHLGRGRLLTLSLDPAMPRHGLAAVPPWSPDVAFIFDRTLSPAVVWRRLAAAGISHVLIAKGEINRRYLEGSPAFTAATSQDLRVVMNKDELVLFAIVISDRPAPP